MPAPNKLNPQCPDCGKQTKRKRQNQDGTQIYVCTHCGWSNSKKRIPRSLLKRKEINAINAMLALRYLHGTVRQQIDVSEAIGGEKWLYSREKLIELIEDGK
jgi:Zn ribbon nucleic-acid-binding protein